VGGDKPRTYTLVRGNRHYSRP